MSRSKVLIAGIGSGSLGMELAKCISEDPTFVIYGADSNPLALGHSDAIFGKTLTTRAETDIDYAAEIIDFCLANAVAFVVPGGESTNKIITEQQDLFRKSGVTPLVNSLEVYKICSDKVACNDFLTERGIPAPRAIDVGLGESFEFDRYPCIVKPSRNSGASNLVFLAENEAEARFFVDYIQNRGGQACLQEYIDGEEFTVGVMSDQAGRILSSVALRRDLSSKLSRSLQYDGRIVSSGWSQGDIDDYPIVRNQCEAVASALGSVWAINIQGRLSNGLFFPFEINPRHSGTSYFRALSGVNEILLGINALENGKGLGPVRIRPATFYRVLSEKHFYKDVK